MVEAGAAFYRARAAEMRAIADVAQSGPIRDTFLLLEASWARLAESVEKSGTQPAAQANAMSKKRTKGLTHF
jgi:hypothetical protein